MSVWDWLHRRFGRGRDITQHFARPAEWTPPAKAQWDLNVGSANAGLLDTDVVAGMYRGVAFRTARDLPILTFGPAGSGKTTGLIVPAVLEWAGSAVVTSTSRDVLERTVAWRSRLGPVMVFGPTVELHAQTRRFLRPWTPLVGCLDRAGSPSWQAALRTARTMVSAAQDGVPTANDAFWGRKAAELLAVALWAVACEDAVARAQPASAARPGTMRAVVELVANCEAGDGASRLKDAVGATKEPLADLVATALLALPPQTLGGACATAMGTLGAYLFSEVADAPMADCLRPADLLTGRATLYMIGAGPVQELYRPIYTALLSWLLYEAEKLADEAPDGRLPVPLLLAIDEAGTIAPLPELARITATVRKAGIRLLTCWHDLSQLDARYGEKNAGTILNNAGSVLILPGLMDRRTTDWVEGAFGLREVIDETTSESRSTSKSEVGERTESRQQSTNRSLTRLPLVPAGAVPTMPQGTMLALIPPHRLTLQQRRYYEQPELKARTEGSIAAIGPKVPRHGSAAPGAGPGRLQPRTGY